MTHQPDTRLQRKIDDIIAQQTFISPERVESVEVLNLFKDGFEEFCDAKGISKYDLNRKVENKELGVYRIIFNGKNANDVVVIIDRIYNGEIRNFGWSTKMIHDEEVRLEERVKSLFYKKIIIGIPWGILVLITMILNSTIPSTSAVCLAFSVIAGIASLVYLAFNIAMYASVKTTKNDIQRHRESLYDTIIRQYNAQAMSHNPDAQKQEDVDLELGDNHGDHGISMQELN
jgi:hypothetical protein